MVFRLDFHFLFAIMLQGKFNSEILDLSITISAISKGFCCFRLYFSNIFLNSSFPLCWKVSITWPDEHTSEYEAEWLKKRCFSEKARAVMRADLFLPGRNCYACVKCKGFNTPGVNSPGQKCLCEDQGYPVEAVATTFGVQCPAVHALQGPMVISSLFYFLHLREVQPIGLNLLSWKPFLSRKC